MYTNYSNIFSIAEVTTDCIHMQHDRLIIKYNSINKIN